MNAPLLFGYDGWLYLRLAREAVLAEGFGGIPALSTLLAVAAKVAPLEVIGFWLPPLLALVLLPVVYFWGRLLSGNIAGAIAVLAVACSPFWNLVTGFGMLDTKCLAPVLITIAAFVLSGFARAELFWAVVRLALFVAISALAVWWWKPSAGFCLLSLAAAVAARAVTSRISRIAVLGLAMLVGALLTVAATGAHETLPTALRDILHYAERHLALVFRTDPTSAAVADSIIELAPLSIWDLSRLTTGSFPAMAAAVSGLGLAFAHRPREMAPLAPLVLALLMAMFAKRLIILFVPAMGLGFGVFAVWAMNAMGKVIHRPHASTALTLTLIAALLGPAFWEVLWQRPQPPFTRQDDELALAVRRTTPPGTVIWSWWDYGYFFQDRASRPTFFDGGSQTFDNGGLIEENDCFVAAFPLANPDPLLAVNWMRFFARAGRGEFARIASRIGSNERALTLLVRLFSGKEDQGPILAELSDLAPDDARAHFFPRVNVCIVLPSRFLSLSGYWMTFANLPGKSKSKAINHIDVLAAKGLEIRPAEGRIKLPDAALVKGYNSVPSAVELIEPSNNLPLIGNSLRAPILFYKKGAPLVYITDNSGAMTLAFRLVAPTGFTHPLFKTVYYDQEIGGAWMLAPSFSSEGLN